MFKNKGMKTIKKPYVMEPKITNPLIHVVNVNMVFKDREPIKRKYVVGWEEE
jgi:hypothetical protein